MSKVPDAYDERTPFGSMTIQLGIAPCFDHPVVSEAHRPRPAIRIVSRPVSERQLSLFDVAMYRVSRMTVVRTLRKLMALALARTGMTYRKISEVVGMSKEWVFLLCKSDGHERYRTDWYVRKGRVMN